MLPLLFKPASIIGNHLILRNATLADADFIYSLRTDDELSKHISSISFDIKHQKEYLLLYENDIKQVYFIIERQGCPVGTVRLYDQQQDSFCWGSWVIKKGEPSFVSIESALIVYSYAIDILGFERSHFDVRKENLSVIRFHEKFGATRVREDALNYYYNIDSNAINISRKRYQRFLPCNIEVIEL